MESKDLIYKWNEENAELKHYSLDEIKLFKEKKSKNIYQQFNRSIIFDICLKLIIGIAFFLSFVLLIDSSPYQYVSLFFFILSTFFVVIEFNVKSKMKGVLNSDSIIENIIGQIKFLRNHYAAFIVLSSISSSLIILSGSFLYYYFKYGGVNLDGWDDFVVLLVFMLIGFLINFIAARVPYVNNLRDLKQCIEELDNAENSSVIIRLQNRKQRKILILSISLAVIGLLGFLLLLWLY